MSSDDLPAIRPLRDAHPELTLGMSGQMLQAAELMLHEPHLKDVAQKVGVSRQTLYNWLQAGKFQVYLSHREAELIQAAARRMARLVNDSTILLDRAMKGEGEELTVDQKFSIEVVTKRGPKLLDQSLVYTRLAGLEEKLSELLE